MLAAGGGRDPCEGGTPVQVRKNEDTGHAYWRRHGEATATHDDCCPMKVLLVFKYLPLIPTTFYINQELELAKIYRLFKCIWLNIVLVLSHSISLYIN